VNRLLDRDPVLLSQTPDLVEDLLSTAPLNSGSAVLPPTCPPALLQLSDWRFITDTNVPLEPDILDGAGGPPKAIRRRALPSVDRAD
jgi:hypothetical protein